MNWTQKKIVEWHKKTFPNETLTGMLLKLEEEVKEVYESQKNGEKEHSYEEMVDVMIVSIVLAGRFDSILGKYFRTLNLDYAVPNLDERINKKMEINQKRIWIYKNGVYRHKEGK